MQTICQDSFLTNRCINFFLKSSPMSNVNIRTSRVSKYYCIVYLFFSYIEPVLDLILFIIKLIKLNFEKYIALYSTFSGAFSLCSFDM